MANNQEELRKVGGKEVNESKELEWLWENMVIKDEKLSMIAVTAHELNTVLEHKKDYNEENLLRYKLNEQIEELWLQEGEQEGELGEKLKIVQKLQEEKLRAPKVQQSMQESKERQNDEKEIEEIDDDMFKDTKEEFEEEIDDDMFKDARGGPEEEIDIDMGRAMEVLEKEEIFNGASSDIKKSSGRIAKTRDRTKGRR